MDEKLKAALREVAMGHLLGEYDFMDICHELPDDFPTAWDQLPAAAKVEGLKWAQDQEDEDGEDHEDTARRMRHQMNAGAIHHEISRLLTIAKEKMTPPLPG